MIRFACLAFAIVILGSTGAHSQDVLKPKTPQQVFTDARDLMNSGSLEVAGDVFKEFLALNPTAQDYLDIEAKYGPTTFLKLRTIPRWYDDPKRDAEFKKSTLETMVNAAIAANETLLKNPNRIAKFVRNLGGVPEEYAFAVAELKRSGDAIVPQLIEAVRQNPEPEYRAAVLRAITELGPEIIPGVLAASEAMKDEYQLLLLGAISKRPDFLSLTGTVDTNIIPYLWNLAALPKTDPNPLRHYAANKLSELYAAAYERRLPEEELTRLARPLYDRQAKFLARAPDNRVKLWSYDKETQTVKSTEVSLASAEETFGLKYLRWAIDRNSKYDPAIDLFLAFATERAVERIKFANLAAKDPAVFRLLAATPASTLIRLLEGALAGKRTALALGLVQALGDRAEPSAGNIEARAGGGDRPPVLVKALDYPDPRVQLAAALALLNIPNAKHGANARIVDVLKRAIAPDAAAGTSAGKALVADPSLVRGDQVAKLLRDLGYQVEVLGSGKALAQRMDARGDFDIILVDRHIVQPTLADLVPQIRAGVNTARRPLLIVASADARAQLGLETLLVRLAALIAATETVDLEIPDVPPVDRRKPIDEIERARKAVVDVRDRRFRQLYEIRLARLQKLMESANIGQSEQLMRRLDLRLPQLTMAALIAEFSLTPTSAPTLVRDFNQLTDLIRRQSDLESSVRGLDTTALVRLEQQMEGVLTPELRKTFETLRTKLDDEALALAPDSPVDPATKAALLRLSKTYPGVSVIREPYSRVGFEEDVNAAMPDAAQRPRDPVEKIESSKAAVEALAKLAVGSIPGYDVKPAADALRSALVNDALAPAAAEALGYLSIPAAQTDLVKLASDNARDAAIRRRAAAAIIWNVQSYGKQATPDALTALAQATSKDPELSSDLAILNAIFRGSPQVLIEALKSYTPTLPAAPVAKEPAPMPKKDEEPKQEPEPKKDM